MEEVEIKNKLIDFKNKGVKYARFFVDLKVNFVCDAFFMKHTDNLQSEILRIDSFVMSVKLAAESLDECDDKIIIEVECCDWSGKRVRKVGVNGNEVDFDKSVFGKLAIDRKLILSAYRIEEEFVSVEDWEDDLESD